MSETKFTRLPDLALPFTHPLADRDAYRCNRCEGIFYPPESPPEDSYCPYCDEDEA